MGMIVVHVIVIVECGSQLHRFFIILHVILIVESGSQLYLIIILGLHAISHALVLSNITL